MTNLSKPNRTFNYLLRQLKKKGWQFDDAPDLRKEGKAKHAMKSVVFSLVFGLLTNKRTLRDVEDMTTELGPWARDLVPAPISDTTMDTELRRLDVPYLSGKLRQQVLEMHRSKMLKPFWLPFGVATIDGKNLATLKNNEKTQGAHPRGENCEKWIPKGIQKDDPKSYYLMPVLRATLSSTEAKPCIGQLALPPGRGESPMFRAMVDALIEAYGHTNLFRAIDGDAGLTSLENADYITEKGYYYVFGLKDNQPILYQRAHTSLLIERSRNQPEAETQWEVRNGRRIRRRLWRTPWLNQANTSVGCWRHLQQCWLVYQETQHKDGRMEVEKRYFISSIPWEALSPQQVLLIVRNHWSIENDVFNSLDIQWREDAAPWCRKGQSVWALGLLRLMAYNLVQYCRKRHLRLKNAEGRWLDPLPWRRCFEVFREVMRIEFCDRDCLSLTI